MTGMNDCCVIIGVNVDMVQHRQIYLPTLRMQMVGFCQSVENALCSVPLTGVETTIGSDGQYEQVWQKHFPYGGLTTLPHIVPSICVVVKNGGIVLVSSTVHILGKVLNIDGADTILSLESVMFSTIRRENTILYARDELFPNISVSENGNMACSYMEALANSLEEPLSYLMSWKLGMDWAYGYRD